MYHQFCHQFLSTMTRIRLIMLLLLTTLQTSGSGSHVFPDNVVVLVGNSIELRCNSSNDDQIEWRCRCNRPPYGEDDITHKGRPINGYNTKYESHREQNGIFVLKLIDAEPSDSGDYVCVGDGGFGNKAYAHVVVTEAQNHSHEVPAAPTFTSIQPNIVNIAALHTDDQPVAVASSVVIVGVAIGIAGMVLLVVVVVVLRKKLRDKPANADDERKCNKGMLAGETQHKDNHKPHV